MTLLRGGRNDRGLLALLWLLTVAVLAVGIAAGSPVLLVWGAIGLLGAGFTTYVFVRDRRQSTAHARPGAAGGVPEPPEQEAP